jgi:hypothetical protein
VPAWSNSGLIVGKSLLSHSIVGLVLRFLAELPC